ncbi:hypothetical protein ACJZ2D_013212 [Fusarium nematophilum]
MKSKDYSSHLLPTYSARRAQSTRAHQDRNGSERRGGPVKPDSVVKSLQPSPSPPPSPPAAQTTQLIYPSRHGHLPLLSTELPGRRQGVPMLEPWATGAGPRRVGRPRDGFHLGRKYPGADGTRLPDVCWGRRTRKRTARHEGPQNDRTSATWTCTEYPETGGSGYDPDEKEMNRNRVVLRNS